MRATAPVLQVEGLTKSYGAVAALQDVTFSLRAGEILAILGDNGAGKSTLVKCLSGVLRPDSGSIVIDGEPVTFGSARDAQAHGIETVYQGLALVPTLDVAANLFLNREDVVGKGLVGRLGWLNRKKMYRTATEVLERLGIRVPSVRSEVAALSGGQRQAIAIGRAAAWGRHIVLLDEPAAALGVEQASHVLELVRRLASEGVGVIVVSHNMKHVIDTCHRAVVLRHGRKVGDVPIEGITERGLIDLITGTAA